MTEKNNKTAHIPRHVAIIPDGNRRWAEKHGRKPWEGHDVGAQRIEEIAKKAREIGVQYLSLWGSSKENMQKRSLQERKALVEVYRRYFDKLINSTDIVRDRVRINIIGGWRQHLPRDLVQLLEDGIEKTKEYDQYFINFFLSYSGDDEMVHTVRSIIEDGTNADDVTKKTIKEHLYTKDLPAVDYLIRTGGEPHLSAGFMMWEIANAQLYFSDTLFPDFGGSALEEAVDEFANRSRRLGA
jgi:undecaprenyl diphosphate synthase